MPNIYHEPPLKPWLNFSFLFTTKITHIFLAFMKGFIGLCLVVAISLLTYTIGNRATRWHNTPSQPIQFQNFDYQTAIETDNVGVMPIQINKIYDGTNLSHIVFGISGTANSWKNRRYYVESWWKPNVTRGFVWLDESPATWPVATSPPYRLSANTDKFKYTCWYGTRAAIRIARIVKETFELGLENVRWFVMGDDDTVFFLENLVTVLQKYDHREMYYIGSNSESIEQDVVHSYTMGYGGAGFAISYPLAAKLVKILDGCINRYESFYGSDSKIGGCMSEIGVPLSKELGFHQVDLRGDLYGFLAAHPVAPLVSLHHLDYLNPIFPKLNQIESVNKLIRAHKLDPGRTLQHTFCYDLTRNWSISVSWGYTVQIYPNLVHAMDLQTPFQTFLTWKSWATGPFQFNTRPLSNNPCEKPVVYFLDRVEQVGHQGRQTVSFYKRFLGNDLPEKVCEKREFAHILAVDTVRVSTTTFELGAWKKAPRRQCCEIVNNPKGATNSSITVNVRDCNDFESVSPP